MKKNFIFLQKRIIMYNPKAVIIWTFVLHPSHISCSKINLTGSMSQINLMSSTDILLDISYQFIYIFVLFLSDFTWKWSELWGIQVHCVQSIFQLFYLIQINLYGFNNVFIMVNGKSKFSLRIFFFLSICTG